MLSTNNPSVNPQKWNAQNGCIIASFFHFRLLSAVFEITAGQQQFTAAPRSPVNWTKFSPDSPPTPLRHPLIKASSHCEHICWFSERYYLTLVTNIFLGVLSKTTLHLIRSKWKARVNIYIFLDILSGIWNYLGGLFHSGPAWLPRSISCHFAMCVNSWQVVGVSDWEVSLSIRGDSINLSRSGLQHCKKTPQRSRILSLSGRKSSKKNPKMRQGVSFFFFTFCHQNSNNTLHCQSD